jgi:tRNA(fMet)-specific endonuclease VapC
VGLILDSSILIAAERRRFDVHDFIETEAPMERVFIAAVTASELLHGVHRADPTRRTRREAFVEAVLRETPVLVFDMACARRHAKLWADLESAGTRIGAHDMQIAATCLAYDQKLATLNESEFARVKGLKLARTQTYLK